MRFTSSSLPWVKWVHGYQNRIPLQTKPFDFVILHLDSAWAGCKSPPRNLHLIALFPDRVHRFWLKYAVVTPNQLTAAALVVSYWVGAERVNPGIWITVFLSIIVALNFVNHRLPSKIEFYVSSFKLVVMLGLMILSTVIGASQSWYLDQYRNPFAS